MSRSRLPMPLAKLLELDKSLTKLFCDRVAQFCPEINHSYRVYLKALEISCHGLPWLALTLIGIYLFGSSESREVQINLLFGLLYDIMLVAFIKAVTRRARPVRLGQRHDMFLTIGVDKFSFPSGHAARAVFLAFFFCYWAYPEMWILGKFLLVAWAVAICISRVLLHRHHILDVVGGAFIGYLEFFLVGILWVGPAGSKTIGDWISTAAEDEYN